MTSKSLQRAYDRCLALETEIKRRIADGMHPPGDQVRFVDDFLKTWRDAFEDIGIHAPEKIYKYGEDEYGRFPEYTEVKG